MTVVPVNRLSAPQWADLHTAYYSPQLMEDIGIVRTLLPPMQLVDFYRVVMEMVKTEKVFGWVAFDGEDFLGYSLILRNPTLGEPELITVIADEDHRNGLGVRLSLRAVRHAFNKWKAEWCTAFVFKDLEVVNMLKRAGFKPFSNFLVLDKATFDARWQGEQV